VGRYLGPVCRLCRREREKLYLKGAKCDSLKCPMERRPYPPGMHGRERTRLGSDYLVQLREKQKLRRIYGVLETQFRNEYERASRQPGMTGVNLLLLLERRLDNIVFRAGWAASRAQARQFVSHGHILVDGKRVTIASYKVTKGQVVSLSDKAKGFVVIRHNLEVLNRPLPRWLESSEDRTSVTLTDYPAREELQLPVAEHLIVELYSK
jgi:small subunit ribosomal protein S4